MKYAVRINLLEGHCYPEYWPTLTADNYTQATAAAKPWIDAGYLVEITPVPEGTDPGE